MTEDIALTCACGAFQATIRDASPRTGNHAICYCIDCQAFARHLRQTARVLDPEGGTEIYQTQPFQVTITAGADRLAVLQLAEKGLYRWYAECCDTPICNTLGTPKMSFVGFMVANMTPPLDVLGPIQFRYKRDQALSPVAAPAGSIVWLGLKTMRNAMRSRINGKWRQTPFFDVETGRSVAKPRRLTDAERIDAYRS